MCPIKSVDSLSSPFVESKRRRVPDSLYAEEDDHDFSRENCSQSRFARYAVRNTRVALSTTVAICSGDGEGLAWKMKA